MKKLLVIGQLPEQLTQMLQPSYELVNLWQATDPEAFLRSAAGQHDAAVTMAKHAVPAGLYPSIQGKALISYGVGTENLRAAEAHSHDVQVSNTPDTATTGVAEMAIGLMLAASRRIAEGDRYVRAGKWEQTPFGVSSQITGKRLGIVGLGRIGRTIARFATAFEMEIGYTGRRPYDDVSYRYLPDVTALAEWCDYLVLSCPGGPETHHLVSGEVLAALGPRAYLINVARGSVVDESALIQALQDGTIAGAGIDVCESEPATPPAMRELERLVITPHTAAVTNEGRQAMCDLVVRNLESYFQTGRVATPVGH